MNISISFVLFSQSKSELEDVINNITQVSHSNSKLNLIFVDNSIGNDYEKEFRHYESAIIKITYIKSKLNGGYGYGHNIALKHSKNKADIHIIANTDIQFHENFFIILEDLLILNPKIGCVGPAIYDGNGNWYPSRKRLPNPFIMGLRFLKIEKVFFPKVNSYYEGSEWSPETVLRCNYLSGACMILNQTLLQHKFYFDEMFFMYPEDIDLSTRINKSFPVIFYPKCIITHNHNKESFKNKKLKVIHAWNIIKYFWKWGIFPEKRVKNSLVAFSVKTEKQLS